MQGGMMRPLRILTWHVHGSYLWYLTARSPHEFYLPVTADRSNGYGGRGRTFTWSERVFEVPAARVREMEFDCVLFQSADHYLRDQYRLLTSAQRQLPRIFLEHDPPRQHPTDTRHVAADDPETLIVHVTPFNALMWDNGEADVRVIEHGVDVGDARYTGEIERGITVVNNMRTRGRRLGADIFARARSCVPLDLCGMDALSLDGLGEIPPPEMAPFSARYRFFFHPVRYTSLGLALCEAMMTGMPIVAIKTAEIATVVEEEVNGYADTNPESLIDAMKDLLSDASHARRLGDGARAYALERFGIERFTRDWNDAFAHVTATRSPAAAVGTSL
jgi:hypothetical protein